MAYRLDVEIPDLPMTPNQLLGRHWRVRQRHQKKWAELMRIVTARKRPKRPIEKAWLTLTRYSSCRPDRDNLVASWKAPIDGLRASRIIADDAPEVVLSLSGDNWEWAARKRGRVRIVVEELHPNETPRGLNCLEKNHMLGDGSIK